jgi:hypothetical protein
MPREPQGKQAWSRFLQNLTVCVGMDLKKAHELGTLGRRFPLDHRDRRLRDRASKLVSPYATRTILWHGVRWVYRAVAAELQRARDGRGAANGVSTIEPKRPISCCRRLEVD